MCNKTSMEHWDYLLEKKHHGKEKRVPCAAFSPVCAEEKEDSVSPFVHWPTCVWSIEMQTKTTANGMRWTQRSIIVSQCGSFSSKEASCTKIPWGHYFFSHQSGISGWPTKADTKYEDILFILPFGIFLNFIRSLIIKGYHQGQLWAGR